MSAFFFALNRNGDKLPRQLAEQMLQSLQPYGRDGSSLICEPHFALGYQSQWCVAEEVGEQQPLVDSVTQQWFAFHGRIDNREFLLNKLPLFAQERPSDAQLFFAYLQAYGESQINDVIGPFVFVWYDQKRDQLLAARDAMGARSLVYYLDHEWLLIATSESALLANGAIEFDFDDAKVARLLTGEMDVQPTSLLERVAVLGPGQQLTVGARDHALSRYYRAPDFDFDGWHDQDYAQEFRRLLMQATRRRLRTTGRVGTMLSGGLDSVPMSICAALTSEQSVDAYSWCFDEFPNADEREFSRPVCQNFKLIQYEILCDQVWPAFDASMYVNPALPVGSPYSEFQQRTLSAAAENGVTALLTGIHGDLLYESTHGLLYSLARQGRWRDAWSELRRLWRAVANKWLVVKYYLLLPIPWIERLADWKKRKGYTAHPSLQAEVARQSRRQQMRRHWLSAESRVKQRPNQWRVVMDGFAGEDMAYGRLMEAKFGVERRYPYRDRDLCEFMLSVPSDQLYFQGTKRPIVKRAFANDLPQNLRQRNSKTSFNSVIDAGMLKDFASKPWFTGQNMEWAHYIRPDFFTRSATEHNKNNLLRWRCGYYDYWKSVCYNQRICELGQSDEYN